MLIPPVTFSSRPMSSPSSHDHSSEALCFVQAPLNNHIFVIFRCTVYSKGSLERSFFYLNVDASFDKIGLEATEKCLFEDDQFTLFDNADAFDRRQSPLILGRCYGNSIAFQTQLQQLTRVERASCL